jgi:CheY-like chemotaxis protein
MALDKKPHHIILADDDEDDREIFRMALHELHIAADVVFAENGGQLLEHLKKRRPEIIFLDLNMPLINGFECLNHIRNNPDMQHVPIIILSTSNSNNDINKCYEMGSTYYIVKPFSYLQLSRIIGDLFEKNLDPKARPSRSEFIIQSKDA